MCEKRLVVRICAGNCLKCEYVRETAKSAIPHRRTLSLPLSGVIIQIRVTGRRMTTSRKLPIFIKIALSIDCSHCVHYSLPYERPLCPLDKLIVSIE